MSMTEAIRHDGIDWELLRSRAAESAKHAYAPYSKFYVGAAGLVDDGRIVTGCNVENASYGLTLCAECGMISELHQSGGGRLIAAVMTNREGDLLQPCGRCRQLLHEAGGPECAVNITHTVRELLPYAFGPDDLKD